MFALAPFEQYTRARDGLDQVWCENLVEIFVRAGVALGLPLRRVEVVGLTLEAEGPVVAVSDSHTTVELFDEDGNRWIWMDPMLDLLGIELPGLGPLHHADFLRFMGDPNLAPKLVVTTLDPETGAERTGPPDADTRRLLANFTRRGQRLVYTSRVR